VQEMGAEIQGKVQSNLLGVGIGNSLKFR
jgi:hypothetical protein